MSGEKQGLNANFARRATILQVTICLVCVGFMLVANLILNKRAVAERTLNAMAKDYYENYFYDVFLAGDNGSAEAFGAYATTGFPEVDLRQLLTFDNLRNSKYVDIFGECNKKKTTVKITPTEPYTRTSFGYETKLDCDFK